MDKFTLLIFREFLAQKLNGAINANIRVHNEIMFGVNYDIETRKKFEAGLQ